MDMVERNKGNVDGSPVPSARGFCDEDRATEMQGTQALPQSAQVEGSKQNIWTQFQQHSDRSQWASELGGVQSRNS